MGSCFRLCGTVGEGEFGKVMLAKMTTNNSEIKVAVKTLKEGHSEDELKDLVKEMEIMKVIKVF